MSSAKPDDKGRIEALLRRLKAKEAEKPVPEAKLAETENLVGYETADAPTPVTSTN